MGDDAGTLTSEIVQHAGFETGVDWLEKNGAMTYHPVTPHSFTGGVSLQSFDTLAESVDHSSIRCAVETVSSQHAGR